MTQNKVMPEGSLVLGNPAKVVRGITVEERESIIKNAKEYVEEAQGYLRGEIS